MNAAGAGLHQAGAGAAAGLRFLRRPAVWLALGLAVVVLLLFRAYVPLNMDEFVSYQTLACLTHPFSLENVFTCPCASFYLEVLGRLRLPLLSYDYIGSLSSFLYAPFYFAWPSPLSARATGLIALLIQAGVLARMFRFSAPVAFCCLLLFFPYSFAHIADTGPVAFQTTSVFLVCYLLRRWLLCRRRAERAWLAMAAGLVVALGCWVKPTYFFVSLGLAATGLVTGGLALARRHGDRSRRILEFGLLIAAAAVPALLIYYARRPGGGAYLPVLTTRFVPDQVLVDGIGERLRTNVLPLLVDPLAAASFCFDVLPSLPWPGLAVLASGLGLMVAGAFRRRAARRHRSEILLGTALFFLALLLVATNVYAKSMHHVVLAYPFAVLAAARSIQVLPRGFLARGAVAAFVLVHAALFALLPSMYAACRQQGSSKAFVAPLAAELNAHGASDSVIACADWGIYFVQALYGPRDQVVLYLRPADDPAQLDAAAAVARRYRRDLTLVGLDGNADVTGWLRARHPGVAARTGPGAGSPWRIWRIPHGELGAPEAAARRGDAPAVLALGPPAGQTRDAGGARHD